MKGRSAAIRASRRAPSTFTAANSAADARLDQTGGVDHHIGAGNEGRKRFLVGQVSRNPMRRSFELGVVRWAARERAHLEAGRAQGEAQSAAEEAGGPREGDQARHPAGTVARSNAPCWYKARALVRLSLPDEVWGRL